SPSASTRPRNDGSSPGAVGRLTRRSSAELYRRKPSTSISTRAPASPVVIREPSNNSPANASPVIEPTAIVSAVTDCAARSPDVACTGAPAPSSDSSEAYDGSTESFAITTAYYVTSYDNGESGASSSSFGAGRRPTVICEPVISPTNVSSDGTTGDTSDTCTSYVTGLGCAIGTHRINKEPIPPTTAGAIGAIGTSGSAPPPGGRVSGSITDPSNIGAR